jgi:hypothetical protein
LGAFLLVVVALLPLACFGALAAPCSATAAVCVVVVLASAFIVGVSFPAHVPRTTIH